MDNNYYSDEVIASVLDNFNKWMVKELTRHSVISQFQWIGISPEINISGVCFQHICFRICSNIYSCLIYLYDSSITGNLWRTIRDTKRISKDVLYKAFGTIELIPTPFLCVADERVSICSYNNLIPCRLLLDVKKTEEPMFIREDFEDAKTRALNTTAEIFIDLFKKEEDYATPVKMSGYELNAMALNIVLKSVGQSGITIQAFTDMPDISPSIYCRYGDQKYAIVLHPYVSYMKPKKVDLPYRLLRKQGFRVLVAPIGFDQTGNAGSLIRGAETMCNYYGELWEVHSFLGIKFYKRFFSV